MARNHGEDSAEGELIVKSVTTIVAGPTDTTQTLGSTIRMECEVGRDKIFRPQKKIFESKLHRIFKSINSISYMKIFKAQLELFRLQ